MDIGSICQAAKPLGHSWPGPHWWMTLTAADQGAWASGVASFFAALVALHIASRERRLRKQKDLEHSLIAASFIYSNIMQLVIYAAALRDFVARVESSGELSNEAANQIHLTSSHIRKLSDELPLDVIAGLQVREAVAISRAVGGFIPPASAIVNTLNLLFESPKFTYEKVKEPLSSGAKAVLEPMKQLVPFLEWYGGAYPRSRANTEELLERIAEQVAKA